MSPDAYTIRIPRKWIQIALTVTVTALVVAPLTALATHSFTDVPNTNTFHSDIAWLKNSGVTKGCNPPANTEYCPDDNVTRGQMAAFMHRFSQYLGAEDGTPAQADNANRVKGKTLAELLPRMAAQQDAPGTVSENSSGPVEVNKVTITAPVDGFLVISGMAYVNNQGLLQTYILAPLVDGNADGLTRARQVLASSGDTANQEATLSYELTVPVTAGKHTITQTLGPASGVGSFFYDYNNLTVMFIPEGQGTLTDT